MTLKKLVLAATLLPVAGGAAVRLPRYNSVGSTANPYKYGGKEFDTFGGTDLYDFHARYHAPSTGRFMTVDPMAEKYPGISPYIYCAGNPILFVDPSGMKIDEASKGDWDKLKEEIKDKMSELVGELSTLLNSGNDVSDMSLRIQSLNSTLKSMDGIEKSTQTYALNKIDIKQDGQLSYDSDKDIISINYNSTANFVHEVTHASQFESGEIGFMGGKPVLQDIYDEVNAYKSQYAFERLSVVAMRSSFSIFSYNEINRKWVQGLYGPMNSRPYGLNGMFNTGINSININSTIEDLKKAYPNQRGLESVPNGLVRHIPYLHYKK